MRPLSFGLLVALVLLAAPSPGTAQPAEAAAQAAVSAPTRPAADVARDGLRKPAALLVFSGIKRGDRVADIMPGQGYFTRLFRGVVGPNGRVYAVVPTELAQVNPKGLDAIRAAAAEPGMSGVQVLTAPTAEITAPEPLDLAWTSDNYHDLYAFFGPDKAAQLDAAVFKALKPGGVFIVIDHVAAAGGDAAAVRRLHRIDPEVVRAQVTAAGFKLEAQSAILANPDDTHLDPIFSPTIRGRTDQFVFRFRKPG